jgi:hypothetical protein
MIKRSRLLQITSAICGVALTAGAQGFLTDQHNDPAVPPAILGYWTLSYPGADPIGQEFTPSLTSLDFVDLMLYGGGGTAAGTFQVAIHQGSITSSLVGMSAPTVRSDGAESVTHFDFPSSISLVPNDIYVMELLQTAGDQFAWGVGATAGGYSGGQMIWGGQPSVSGDDLWFREGVGAVPEPGSASLYTLAAAICCVFRRRHISNPQGGANGRQPFTSEANSTSTAAGSRRSP